MAEIKVKALIDKEKNKLLFVESNADFVDLLFSFLTMPIGAIIKLTSKQTSAVTIGSMSSLYESVQSLSVNHFQTSQCKDMLLSPRSGAEAHLKKIRPALDEYRHFFCNSSCVSQEKRFSYFKNTSCVCGKFMSFALQVPESTMKDKDGGVFVKGMTKYLISDELQIVPLSTVACFTLLLKQGVSTINAIEEKVIGLGKNEILSLLKSLFASKNPLTKILLKDSPIKEPNEEIFYHHRATKKRKIVPSSGGGHFSVKLFLSKSRDVVCFAEASEDFIDLLFSFLTIPLGNIMKEHGNDGPFTGCARHLHESVQKLDAINLISDEIRQFLLCPKVAPHFGVHKELLGVEEVGKQYFCTVRGSESFVAADKSLFKDPVSSYGIQELTLLDPKSSYELTLLDPKSSSENEGIKTYGGYVKGPTMFTITDDLVIQTSSAISGAAILYKLNIPFDDIEERTVSVGKEEAISLLVASFISKSPLTDVFIRKVPKEEH